MIPALLATMLADKGLELLSGLFDTGSKAVVKKTADFVKDKTGIDLQAESDLTVGQIADLKKFEATHFKDLLAMQYADTANARDMQKAALQQDDVFSKRFIYYFAGLWSVFAMGYIFAITFFAIPADSVRFADTILGFLLGTVIAVLIQFFYGSSAGSSKKTDMLNTKQL